MTTNNVLSAFGISWHEQPIPVSGEELNGIHTVGSFARALRQPRQSGIAVSSICGEPIPHYPDHKRDEEVDDTTLDYEDGTTVPCLTKGNGSLRLMTRKGQILQSDPYRLRGVPDRSVPNVPHAKDDFEIDYNTQAVAKQSDAQVTLRSVQASQPSIQPAKAVRVSQAAQVSASVQYSDRDTLLRLEGVECFPLEHPHETQGGGIGDTGEVPLSKFSSSDSSSPPRQHGIFRSVSKKIKNAVRRQPTLKKATVSGPTNFLDLDPRYPNCRDVHPDIKAVPLAEAQKKLHSLPQLKISAPFDVSPGDTEWAKHLVTKSTPIEHPAPELAHRHHALAAPSDSGGQHPYALRAKLSKSKKPKNRRGAAPPPIPLRPRKVKVVGGDDRVTEFGDFIDAAIADSSSDEVGFEKNLPNDGDFSILDIKPIRIPRKPLPSKKVDTSRYDWMPPPSPFLPTTAKVSSQHDWRMSEEYPTVDDLFEQLDHQVAEIGIPVVETLPPDVYVPHHKQVLDQPSPGHVVGNDDGSEPEVLIDTFLHDSHSSWIATEQPRATRHRFEHLVYDNSTHEDEARELMKRLERLRAGNIV